MNNKQVWSGVNQRDSATPEQREWIRNKYLSISGSRYSRIMELKKFFKLSYVFISLVLNENTRTSIPNGGK